jgi:glyceraldehyde 3-phosphate dehydrogenase
MSAKIAINGFGHSGRMLFLATLHHPDLELVAINQLTETASN